MNSNESIFDTVIPWYNFNAIWKIWIEIFKSSSSFAGFRHSQLPLVTWRWTSHQQCNKKHWNASIPKSTDNFLFMDLSDGVLSCNKKSHPRKGCFVFFKTKPKGKWPWHLIQNPQSPPPGWWNHRDTMLQEVVKILIETMENFAGSCLA